MTVKELDSRYITHTYARFPVELTHGAGSVAYDNEGKEYIDLGSGIGVNIFGYCDRQWQAAVNKQLDTLQHTSNLYYTAPCARLAELLCSRTGMSRVFFSNSGAEANECAIKAARQYAIDKKGADYYNIITLKNSFHGRTITTLAATGQDVFHQYFTPMTPGFLYGTANDIDSVIALAENNKCAAVMMEIVQGEGGVIALDHDFICGVADYCREHELLLIIDEVQSGNGRSGMLYAYMNYGITPDIVSTAKGLGGGLPIGATLLGDKVKDVLGAGMHGSTFGGNPVCCAGAISIIERIDDELLDSVKAKSQHIFDVLSAAEGVESVSGIGLMIGIKTVKDASDVVKYCMEHGVLVLKAKDKVRLLPALNIPDELLDRALCVIMDGCRK